MENITLNSPTISEQSNEFFLRLKNKLYDGNVYAKGRNAIGYTNQTIIFDGTCEPSESLLVTINGKTNQTIISNIDGEFRFGIRLVLGKNNVQVKYSTTNDGISETIFLQAYKTHIWLKAYASLLLDIDNERKQNQQNIYLEDDRVDSLNTGNDALKKNFGVSLKVTRPSGYSRDEYRDLLKSIRGAWENATLHESFQIVSNAFVGQDCIIEEYPHTRQFPIGTLNKIRVKV